MNQTSCFDDHVLSDLEAIISSRNTLREVTALVRPGITSIGLIVIPGSYKLALVAAWIEPSGRNVFTQYRDPEDPCYSDLLDIAPDRLLEAARVSIDRQIRDALGLISTGRPKRKRPSKRQEK